jgi:hypothetical protein
VAVDAVVAKTAASISVRRAESSSASTRAREIRARNASATRHRRADRRRRAGLRVASDERYRETDLAIDYAEEVPPLPLEAASASPSSCAAKACTSR